ncbi:MAG: RNA-splicing ligase RtcB [Acidobacteria bacterium 13_1_40CM_4_65_8]|nr:MAG: RNA-splicing ligase RtcB [Acidobacteria bacterium 13_1_40CM_4_65_8]OLE80327.1 MAG: RNA-splicing ligase RtcB [Acidobacteria bacterium 13_1_20CM_2_65_9]
MYRLNDKAVLFLPPNTVEASALRQIENTASMGFIFKHVAVMPDCHFGRGATVGTVLATQGAIIPAAVGVDIGCGMVAVKTPLGRGDVADPARIRQEIERRIPMSAGHNNKTLSETAADRVAHLEAIAKKDYESIDRSWKLALGTLGGGNHFIELATDESGTVWLTLHSGSRGVGNKIGNLHIKKAQQHAATKNISLPDRDLAYLTEHTPEFDDYVADLRWAQEFARLNREEMMDRVMMVVSHAIYGTPDRTRELEVQRINCHHNFSQVETHFGQQVWITRKGAIQAKRDMWAMIPGSMGTRSYIVTGLENPMAFHSAPHGAGRRYSRTAARKLFTMNDLETAMTGIEFRHSHVLLDEIPSAYKDIDEVIENAKSLIEVKHTLRQFINIKGD